MYSSAILDAPFSISELDAVLSSFKEMKSPGLDGIPIEAYKYSSPKFKLAFIKLLNEHFNDKSTLEPNTSVIF